MYATPDSSVYDSVRKGNIFCTIHKMRRTNVRTYKDLSNPEYDLNLLITNKIVFMFQLRRSI